MESSLEQQAARPTSRKRSSTMLRLLALVAPYRTWFALAVLLGFATVGSSVGLIATSSYLIAKAALMPSIAELNLAIVGVRFFGVGRAVFRYCERYVSHSATFRLLAGVRTWFYGAIEPLAPAGLVDQRGGDLLARVIADVETLEQFYLRVLAPPLVALLVALLTCGLMLAFDLRLALLMLAFQLLAGVMLPLLVRTGSRKLGATTIATRAELSATLVEGIQGMADLLVLGRAEAWQAQVREQSQRLAAAQERLAALRNLSSALVNLLSQLAVVAVLLVAIPLIRGGQIDPVYAALLALVALASFEAVAPLAAALQSLELSLQAAQRLFRLADAPPAIAHEPAASPAPQDSGIVIRALGFHYPQTDRRVFQDFSLTIQPGETVVLSGPSGVGKSTLVNLLLRFWEYDSGSIRLGGHELRRYRGEDARRMIGVVSQNPHLFNGTLRDNLLLACPEAEQAALDRACQRAQLDRLLSRLPQGYDTWIGEQGWQLSGGERQRLAIARALLKDAPILLLDEPTAQLDAHTERELIATLRDISGGRTTLIITHRPELFTNAAQIITLLPSSES